MQEDMEADLIDVTVLPVIELQVGQRRPDPIYFCDILVSYCFLEGYVEGHRLGKIRGVRRRGLSRKDPNFSPIL